MEQSTIRKRLLPFMLGVGIGLAIILALTTWGPFRSGSIVDAVEDIGEVTYAHPDGVAIEFDDSVGERDRKLVELAVEIARPMFERNGFSLDATILVTGDKDSFMRVAQDEFGSSQEDAEADFPALRGRARAYIGLVHLNHGIYEEMERLDATVANRRDGFIVYTTIHELYHVLQVKLSDGWSGFASAGDVLREMSANIAAERAMLEAFCAPYEEVMGDMLAAPRTDSCGPAFVEEELAVYQATRMIYNEHPTAVIPLYIIREFGSDAFDEYYRTIGGLAHTYDDFDVFDAEGAAEAAEALFGFRDINSAHETGLAYFKQHKETILALLEDRYGT